MGRKRDYQRKDFKNPFFPKKKKPKRYHWLKFFLLLLIIGVIIGLYFLNNLNSFQIKNIEITGNEKISQQEIKDIILNQLSKKHWFFFSQSNILFFSKKATKKELAKDYFFEELKIKKRYFDTLEIEIKEKTSFIVWASGIDKYYLDLEGIATRKVEISDLVIQTGEGGTELIRSEADSFGYPLIYDQSNKPVITGQSVVSKDLIDFVISLKEELKIKADFGISYYFVASPDSLDITLVTKEGWEIRFSLKESAKAQADLLFLVLQQKVEARNRLEYIDLRFGGKVFYK